MTYESVIGDGIPDEKVKLEPSEQLCYERLRVWRNETADQEGIPPYVIASNSHLVELVQKRITTVEGLKQLPGFGKKKIEKYGKGITGLIQDFFGE